MSTEWEVVGKQKKPRKIEKKAHEKNVSSPTKIEQFLSNSQIKSLLSNYEDVFDKENKTDNLVKKEEEKPVKKEEKPVPAKPQKLVKVIKPKFKDVDSALKAIVDEELERNLETVNVNFKDNHLMLLKAVTSFLNDYLRVETSDPIFADKSFVYPSNIIPLPLKKIIVEIIKKAGIQNVQHHFDLTLSNLAEDMNKNLPYLGHKIMLQLMATENPPICVSSLARNAILRNSYQNRSNIGLSILWSLGQGGFRDLNVGLKVWQDIMVPVIDLKTYSKYVYEYIHRILSKNKSTRLNLSSSDFLTILSSLTIIKKVSKDLQKLLDDTASLLVEKYVSSSPNASSTFTTLFKNIQFISKPKFIYIGLIQCLSIDPECLESWKKVYRQNIQHSTELLNYIDVYSDDLASKFVGDNLFKQFLKDIHEINEDLGQSKKKIEGLKLAVEAVKQVQEKSLNKKNKNSSKSSKSSSSSCCKFTLVTFLLFGSIGGLIGYDTYSHGGVFESSQTGQVLKQAGVLPYVVDGWTCSMKYSARGFKWTEENVPVYYQNTKSAVGPYLEFSKDFSKILWNGMKKGFGNVNEYVAQKTPVVVDFIEQYAPGLPKKVCDFTCSTWKAVSSFTVQSYKNSVEFFKTRVFVGQLSPESLGKALNSTQVAVAQYYSWFHEKVDFYAKIK